MKCDHCENEAVVHEIVVQKGQKVEKHLCSDCAKQDGLVPEGQGSLSAPLSKLILSSSMIKKPGASPKQRACVNCGCTWAEFRKSGLLGCPDCYDTFEEKLTPLIERAHEGAGMHCGKTPASAGAAAKQQRLVATLRQQLAEAIDAEHYERAAEIRDRLRDLAPGEAEEPARGTRSAAKGKPGGGA